MNYRKMKKMIMGDPSGEVNEEGDSSIAETEDDDDKSEAVSFFFFIVAFFQHLYVTVSVGVYPNWKYCIILETMHIAEHFTTEVFTFRASKTIVHLTTRKETKLKNNRTK